MRSPVYANHAACHRWRVLHVRKHVPGKDQLPFLVCVYAVSTHTDRRFIPGSASRRCPLDSAQRATRGFISLSLESRVEQHRASVAQVFHGVRVHISVVVLQEVHVALVILLPLPLQNADVLMRDTLLGAEEEEIGFARALGIRRHDFRSDWRLHDDLLPCSVVLTPLDVGRCHRSQTGYTHDAVMAVELCLTSPMDFATPDTPVDCRIHDPWCS